MSSYIFKHGAQQRDAVFPVVFRRQGLGYCQRSKFGGQCDQTQLVTVWTQYEMASSLFHGLGIFTDGLCASLPSE